jgi:hypothetical protein
MFITFRGRVDTIEDTSYPRTVKRDGKKVEEVITRFQMSILIPGSNEPVKIDLAGEAIPGQQQMDDWEFNEKWVVADCDGWRHATGTTDDRAWSLVSFSAVEVREMPQKEYQDLQQKRKAIKTKKKEESKKRRQQRQAEKREPEKIPA